MKRIAIFASGGGSNARKILEHFEDHSEIEIGLIVSNKRNAGVYSHANDFGVPTLYIDKHYFNDRRCIIDVLSKENIEWIVLAGFLWLIPRYMIDKYPNRIINIHPALLPKYGGKGMYGMNVHKAVKSNLETQSGPTIHFVNERFDDGAHIFQVTCDILPEDTAEEIASKVLKLEHEHYSRVLEEVISNNG